MTTRQTLYVVSLLYFGGYAIALAQDCSLAEQQLAKGIKEGKQEHWEVAENWFKKSISECNRFDNWYLLGQVQQEQKDYTRAAFAFVDAQKYAEDNDQLALAQARYAQTLSQQGQLMEPLSLLHRARKIHTNPPGWLTDLALTLDKRRMKLPLSVSQITRGLHFIQPLPKASINVTINFEYNSTALTNDSLGNFNVLAESLDDSSMDKTGIIIVGHSDSRGKIHYNQALSEERAQAVALALIERSPKWDGRILTQGRGEMEPLYPGNNSEIYAINRRVEVFLQ